jgi:hypothetical protein
MIIFLRETGGDIRSVTGEGLKPLATSQTPGENSEKECGVLDEKAAI